MLGKFGSEENKLWNKCSMSALFMGMLLKFQLSFKIINRGQFKIQMVNKASKQISKFGPPKTPIGKQLQTDGCYRRGEIIAFPTQH